MTKTVKKHLEESDQVTNIVEAANALVKKLQAELALSRETLESLRDYQHPLHKMRVPYGIRNGRNDETGTPVSIIHLQTERINKLLGDRA